MVVLQKPMAWSDNSTDEVVASESESPRRERLLYPSVLRLLGFVADCHSFEARSLISGCTLVDCSAILFHPFPMTMTIVDGLGPRRVRNRWNSLEYRLGPSEDFVALVARIRLPRL